MLTVGSRLTDFATGSHSIFANPDVRFASSTSSMPTPARRHRHRRRRQAGLAALAEALRGHRTPRPGGPASRRGSRLGPDRAHALDPDHLFDKSARDRPDASPAPTRCSPRASSSGCCRNTPAPATSSSPRPEARPATCRRSGTPPAAGTATWSSASPAWATRSRPPWACGWRTPTRRRGSPFLGDGTFLMAPTELVTAAQEGLRHPGGPREPRLPGDPPAADVPQRPGVRQRVPLPHQPLAAAQPPRPRRPRLDGDYLRSTWCQIAAGLGAKALRANTATSCATR